MHWPTVVACLTRIHFSWKQYFTKSPLANVFVGTIVSANVTANTARTKRLIILCSSDVAEDLSRGHLPPPGPLFASARDYAVSRLTNPVLGMESAWQSLCSEARFRYIGAAHTR